MNNSERQVQRIIEVAQDKGVDCPEMVVEAASPILGGAEVHYRCREDAPVASLMLTAKEAEYVGIDLTPRGRPETGG